MARSPSPSRGDSATKRPRLSLEPLSTTQTPTTVVDVVADSNATLTISGLSSAPAGSELELRVSSHALSLASPVFAQVFVRREQETQAVGTSSSQTVDLDLRDEDNGDAMYILCNMLHLRNDKLPWHVTPEILYKIAVLASKYQCVVAVGRATLPWFDRLHSAKVQPNTWQLIEAAYLLDESASFARFTSRWILEQPLFTTITPCITRPDMQKLALFMIERLSRALTEFRDDIDKVVDSCAVFFSLKTKHFIGCAPMVDSMGPESSDAGSEKDPPTCRVDADGATAYLGALRDAKIWPYHRWEYGINDAPPVTLEQMVDRVTYFREPEYDDCDRCDFCGVIKADFCDAIEEARVEHKKRLWGLCLDCFNTGGVNYGECRYDHPRSQHSALRQNESTVEREYGG